MDEEFLVMLSSLAGLLVTAAAFHFVIYCVCCGAESDETDIN